MVKNQLFPTYGNIKHVPNHQPDIGEDWFDLNVSYLLISGQILMKIGFDISIRVSNLFLGDVHPLSSTHASCFFEFSVMAGVLGF